MGSLPGYRSHSPFSSFSLSQGVLKAFEAFGRSCHEMRRRESPGAVDQPRQTPDGGPPSSTTPNNGGMYNGLETAKRRMQVYEAAGMAGTLPGLGV